MFEKYSNNFQTSGFQCTSEVPEPNERIENVLTFPVVNNNGMCNLSEITDSNQKVAFRFYSPNQFIDILTM